MIGFPAYSAVAAMVTGPFFLQRFHIPNLRDKRLYKMTFVTSVVSILLSFKLIHVFHPMSSRLSTLRVCGWSLLISCHQI
ncbi:hypothetical protein EDB85DRAFT_1955823 [Lactarius pseudohatsudake]|nr:hypothetical protein EDB85DRAFT_2029674 [Lactarius pseudohatsudake]KAH9032441.1 hypothetical protein EDB85DRAFT_1955823 [Lactarius pseudohatsudake]